MSVSLLFLLHLVVNFVHSLNYLWSSKYKTKQEREKRWIRNDTASIQGTGGFSLILFTSISNCLYKGTICKKLAIPTFNCIPCRILDKSFSFCKNYLKIRVIKIQMVFDLEGFWLRFSNFRMLWKQFTFSRNYIANCDIFPEWW